MIKSESGNQMKWKNEKRFKTEIQMKENKKLKLQISLSKCSVECGALSKAWFYPSISFEDAERKNSLSIEQF